MPMKNPPHPGLSLRHDCLEPLGLSVTGAAKKLGVSRKHLSDLINGHSGISPEMAIRLHKAFGGGADTWLRLQAAYDLAQAMKRAKEIKVERITRAA
jgi:addiction module HigA family antidote